MKDRITLFLASEGISPAEFADKIGVQRSSVSHVLNGRNYPSASFIQKMLGSYKTLNPRWLLLGEGIMSDTKSTSVNTPTLFSVPSVTESTKTPVSSVKDNDLSKNDLINQLSDNIIDKQSSTDGSNQQLKQNLTQSMSELVNTSIDNKEVERIVLFFKDKTFTAYTPSN
jgi:transcriptional regulator with XRE-family HTH domain